MQWTPIVLLDPTCMPVKAHDTDSGFDLFAAADTVIKPSWTVKVPLGFKIGIAPGWEGQIRGRSSMNLKGMFVALGTVDSGYSGEVACTIYNSTDLAYEIKKGDKIAQMCIGLVHHVVLRPVAELEKTERGEGGFGSTGTKAKNPAWSVPVEMLQPPQASKPVIAETPNATFVLVPSK